MEKKYIVTITREFGSMARPIARRLSELLNVEFYDRDIVEETARQMNLPLSVVSTNEESQGDIYAKMKSPLGKFCSEKQNEIFRVQSEIIRKLAAKESCVIVGRCADEILAYNPNLVSVFITGDRESKIARVMDREGLDRKQAINKMKRMDKIRKTYHNFYCRNKWGDSRGYDICINTGKTDFDTAKNMVVECVDKLKERSE